MKYEFDNTTGQVTENGVKINSDTSALVAEMNKIEEKKHELAQKYTKLQEDYIRLHHENKILKDRRNYRDIIGNILGKHTNSVWVYESHIVDYHYWTTSKEVSFQPQFFIELENEDLCISEMSIEDDETHIYIRRLRT